MKIKFWGTVKNKKTSETKNQIKTNIYNVVGIMKILKLSASIINIVFAINKNADILKVTAEL